MESSEYIRPLGTYYDIISHPVDRRRAIEVAIVQDHRFAFFYWLKWRNKQAEQPDPPTLISLDWHQDLAQPCDLHVVQKQRDECPEDFVDIEGRTHLIRCYESVEELTKTISGQEHSSVILDIDLDYFTESPDPCGGGEQLQLVSDDEIQACLGFSREWWE